MYSSNDIRVHNTGSGVKRIHSGVDSTFGHRFGQYSGGVQVSEGGGRGRVSQVISWYVNGLDRSNGTLLGGGNSLLHSTHVSGQSGLVSYSGRNTTQQGRHLGTSLGESEDIVNEKQHVLSLLVTEVLGNSQSSEGNTSTSTRGLVHLSVHKGDLGGTVLQRDDSTLNHLVVQIVSFPSSLSDTSEHGETTVSLGDVVNQFHDKYSLADASTAEQTNLSSLTVGGQQVYHLNSSYKNLLLYRHIGEVWSLSVNGLPLVCGYRTSLVNRVTNHIDNTAQSLLSYRDHDGGSAVVDNLASDETLGTVHSNGPDSVLSQMLGNLQDELRLSVVDNESVKNLGKAILELYVHNGTND